MDNFWKWMEENNYTDILGFTLCVICKKDCQLIPEFKMTKQMLIGYMIEYLHSKKNTIVFVNPNKSINNYYNDLEKEIKNDNS